MSVEESQGSFRRSPTHPGAMSKIWGFRGRMRVVPERLSGFVYRLCGSTVGVVVRDSLRPLQYVCRSSGSCVRWSVSGPGPGRATRECRGVHREEQGQCLVDDTRSVSRFHHPSVREDVDWGRRTSPLQVNVFTVPPLSPSVVPRPLRTDRDTRRRSSFSGLSRKVYLLCCYSFPVLVYCSALFTQVLVVLRPTLFFPVRSLPHHHSFSGLSTRSRVCSHVHGKTPHTSRKTS